MTRDIGWFMGEIDLILVGYRGAGKTSVGRSLAPRMGRPFIDLDESIISRGGLSIDEVFRRYGEAGFRMLERSAVVGLQGAAGRIIATGGGSVIDGANRAVLRRLGCVVWLAVDVETVMRRLIRGSAGRPDLTGLEFADEVRVTLAAREDGYRRAAHVTVDAKAELPVVVERVVSAFGKWYDSGPHAEP